MKKSDREKLFNKYGGRCAYCGSVLSKGWHADHIVPVVRGYYKDIHESKKHLDVIGNMNPSCASCNNYKHSYTLEEFRHNLQNGIVMLEKNNPQYRFAKRYGLIQETGIKVKFYFERLQEDKDPFQITIFDEIEKQQ